MSDTHFCRYGLTEPRQEPVSNYDELLGLWTREAPDDGRQADCGTEPWPDNVPCPDCGNGPVVWAEAAFVPGHRICPWCGSHWSLSGDPETERWTLKRARFYGGR